MKIRPIGSRVVPSGRTDGQRERDTPKQTAAFRNLENAPERQNEFKCLFQSSTQKLPAKVLTAVAGLP